mgnify:CR=1 FL=1
MITMTKAFIGPTAVRVAAKPNTSLVFVALVSIADWLNRFGRSARSKSVIIQSRFTLTVNATVTVKASSSARLVSTSGW